MSANEHVNSTHYGLGTGARVHVDGTWSGTGVHVDGTWSGTGVEVRTVGEKLMSSPTNPAAAGVARLRLWARPGSGTKRKDQEARALGPECSGSAGAHSLDPRYL